MLQRLLANAGLPPPVGVEALSGRGFESEIFVVTSEDGRRSILRVRREGTVAGREWAAFLASLDLPMPRVLATDGRAELHEFIAGQTIGDAIEAGVMTGQMWRHAGEAFRRLHTVTFPDRLAGTVGPNAIVPHPCDPVAEVRAAIEGTLPRLTAFGGEVERSFARLDGMVEMLEEAIRRAPASLVHGDVNMWNVLVDAERAVIIDWDYPAVGSRDREIALLDRHAWLFNGVGLPEDFHVGYGETDAAVVGLYRVLETVVWAVSDDWAEFALQPSPLRERARQWHDKLLNYVIDLPQHVRTIDKVLEQS